MRGFLERFLSTFERYSDKFGWKTKMPQVRKINWKHYLPYVFKKKITYHLKTTIPRNNYRVLLLPLWLFISCKTRFFNKIYIICWKKRFYIEKKFYIENFFTEKKFFYREKYQWKCKKYVCHLKNIFFYRKCLCYKQNISLF